MAEPASDDTVRGDRPLAIESLTGWVTWAAAAVAACLVLVSLAVTCFGVVRRYLLNTPVTWVDELSGFLVVGMVMLGAAEALRRGDHINVDLITARISGAPRRALDIWGMALVGVVAVAMIVSAIHMVAFSYQIGIYSEGYLAMPMWIPQSVFLFGAVLMLVMAVVGAAGLLRRRPEK